jgi:hypothetical protein
MAMLHGALNLRRQIFGVGHDEQVYNGAGYTNWGYGVPLLQLPFHAAVPLFRRWIHTRCFPDRLIFFLYLSALLPWLWAAVHRMAFPGERAASFRPTAFVASWCLTLFVLAVSLFDLTSFRFIVYEETIAYFVVFQLFAIAFYARLLDTKNSARWAAAMGVAASLGLLIRPTGLPYLAMWGVLVALEARRWRIVAWFAGAAVPGVAFWLLSNWVRTGSPLSLGYQNANPGYPIHFQMLRFASQCVDTVPRFREVCREIFEALFLAVPARSPILGDCGLVFESRLPGEDVYMGPSLVLLFVVSLVWCAVRRERRIAFYLPHLTIAALFFAYARAGAGLAWRYAGDFWPLFVLLALAELRRIRVERTDAVLGLATACAFYAAVHMVDDVFPALKGLEVLDQAGMHALEEQHELEQATQQPPLPAHVACGQPLPIWARGNGVGWAGNCTVGIVTNVYLGVPASPGKHFKLRIEVDHPLGTTLPVFVNGRNYLARQAGGGYEADVVIDPRRLRSPAVAAAVEWSPTSVAPPIRLLSIELAV